MCHRFGYQPVVFCFAVMTAKDAVGTVAEMLHQSMEGAGTNDDSLTRIILAHSEMNIPFQT